MPKSIFSFPSRWKFVLFTIILFSNFFIFYWRIIALQNFAVFCQTSTSFKLKIICTFYTNSNMHICIYILLYEQLNIDSCSKDLRLIRKRAIFPSYGHFKKTMQLFHWLLYIMKQSGSLPYTSSLCYCKSCY